jgi:predicted enzyme related to lactoylglutathione lyase
MHAVNWFEIPCRDLDRAVKFYESVLDTKLQRMEFMGVPHGIFPSGEKEVGGALVLDKSNSPSPSGTRIYLDATGKLEDCLARVTKHGGEVIVAKTDISPQGFLGVLRDTEGNLVGLHSRP